MHRETYRGAGPPGPARHGPARMGQHFIRMLMTPNTASSPALPPDEKVSAWSLIKPYWVSEERKTAWGLLIAIIVMNLLVVWINVRLNRWSADFYNALQTKNVHDFPQLLMVFSGARVRLHHSRGVRPLSAPDARIPLAPMADHALPERMAATTAPSTASNATGSPTTPTSGSATTCNRSPPPRSRSRSTCSPPSSRWCRSSRSCGRWPVR